MKGLFVFYRAQTADGVPVENNFVLHGIRRLATLEDIKGLQDYIGAQAGYNNVRIASWQRMEVDPPKES